MRVSDSERLGFWALRGEGALRGGGGAGDGPGDGEAAGPAAGARVERRRLHGRQARPEEPRT